MDKRLRGPAILQEVDFDSAAFDAFRRQLGIVAWAVLIIFGILVFRLWFLQVARGPYYKNLSENNHTRIYDIPPIRGTILDAGGTPLADNRPSYDLYVIPEEIGDMDLFFTTLERWLPLEGDRDARIAQITKAIPFKPFFLKRDLSRKELAIVETQRVHLPGLFVEVRPQRHYLFDALGSHMIGYVGEITEEDLRSKRIPDRRHGDLVGKSGVELRYQEALTGQAGGEQVEVDAIGRRLRTLSRKPPSIGASVQLTLERELQSLAERALEGKKGAIVALNPNNGKVLALASSPAFDPNLFVRRMDRLSWKQLLTSRDYPLQNRSISSHYPLGSVFKIVVALAALEEGLITPRDEISCSGFLTLGNRDYRCWRESGHGGVNLHRALVESCDVYFYRLGLKLGVDRIAAYARKLGLGETSGIDLPQEKAGLIPTRAWKVKAYGVPWQDGETVSTAIGQSFVSVTPLQAANLLATVFNGGILYRPQVVEWIGRPGDETLYRFSPAVVRHTHLAQKHLDLLRTALIGVVNEPRGTGSKAKMLTVTVAGKTGTAQVIAQEKRNGTEEKIPIQHRDHAWFVALAPAQSPRIAIAVLVENGGHGGSAAAPIAKEMIKTYLKVNE